MPHIPMNVRKWIYGLALAGIPLLVVYGIIDQTQAPLWIAFLGAVIAPGLALVNLSPDKDSDEVRDES